MSSTSSGSDRGARIAVDGFDRGVRMRRESRGDPSACCASRSLRVEEQRSGNPRGMTVVDGLPGGVCASAGARSEPPGLVAADAVHGSPGRSINTLIAEPLSAPYTTQHSDEDYEVVLAFGEGGGEEKAPRHSRRRR